MIIVTKDNIKGIVNGLQSETVLALDTETSGLYPYHGDRAFAVILANKSEEYYFDFRLKYLGRGSLKHIHDLLQNERTWLFVNAKYDLAILARDKIKLSGRIVDAAVIARVHFNAHKPKFLSMDYLTQYYLNIGKDESVKNYIAENKLFKDDLLGGKNKPDFRAVPVNIMAAYACKDARITYDLCGAIMKKIAADECSIKGYPRLYDLYKQEMELTSVVYEMEARGFTIDRKYIAREMVENLRIADELQASISEIENPNSPKQLGEYLLKQGFELPLTPTGAPKTDVKALEKIKLPMLDKIKESKQRRKVANTYYKNFLKLADADDVIHCGLNQNTTITGRFSCSNPNLQNLKKKDDSGVRNAFIPREGFDLYFFDYSQQEMVFMLDQAGETSVINKVRGGLDFYEATAQSIQEISGVTINRATAKAVSLGLAYGQGVALLAANLGVTNDEAKRIKRIYFEALPKLRALQDWITSYAKFNGYIYNPFGRKLYIERDKEYKALNSFVQSSAADITKRALIDVHASLKDFESALLLTVHDEIVVEIKHGEETLISTIQDDMRNAYNFKHIHLSVDVEKSSTSWGEKTKI